MTNRFIKVWSLPIRLVHWTLVSSVAYAWYHAGHLLDTMSHVYAGYTAAASLFAIWTYGMLVKDFAGFRHTRFDPSAAGAYLLDLLKGKARRYLGHNPAGALAIYTLLILGTMTVATGFLGFEQYDWIVPYETWGDWHATIANTWLCVIAVHIAGVLAGSLSHGENLIWSMVTGNKRRRLQLIDGQAALGHLVRVDGVPHGRVTARLRQRYIQEAAYYLAEKRGFATGYDREDWFEAVRQVDEMLKRSAPASSPVSRKAVNKVILLFRLLPRRLSRLFA